jgi:hypothetical protein
LKEFLPLLIGCIVGLAFGRLRGRARAALPVGCILGGVAASAINSELGGPLWELFVSFDVGMVWLAAAVAVAVHRLAVSRQRTIGTPSNQE